MQFTPKEIFDSEYEDDFQFWFPVDKSDPDKFFPTPYELGMLWFVFTNEKDADHFGYLLHELAPPFKDKEMMAISDSKREIVSTIVPDNVQMALIQRNGAIEFFKEYKDFLGRYYGFE